MTQEELAKTARRMVQEADAGELAALSVSEIARRLLVNRSTLSRAFRAYYPYFTLREFLEREKISKFDMLVMFKKVKTVKKALEILDIRDRNHFIKRYKAARLRTPGEFCKKCRKSHKEWKRKLAEMHGFCDKIKPLKH